MTKYVEIHKNGIGTKTLEKAILNDSKLSDKAKKLALMLNNYATTSKVRIDKHDAEYDPYNSRALYELWNNGYIVRIGTLLYLNRTDKRIALDDADEKHKIKWYTDAWADLYGNEKNIREMVRAGHMLDYDDERNDGLYKIIPNTAGEYGKATWLQKAEDLARDLDNKNSAVPAENPANPMV